MSTATRELLLRLDREPRASSEAVDVWRTSCPRPSVWEDAIADALVEIVRYGLSRSVAVTAAGRETLDGP